MRERFSSRNSCSALSASSRVSIKSTAPSPAPETCFLGARPATLGGRQRRVLDLAQHRDSGEAHGDVPHPVGDMSAAARFAQGAYDRGEVRVFFFKQKTAYEMEL